MRIDAVRDALERNQIVLYFAAVAAATVSALIWPAERPLEPAIDVALAFMLLVTFLQLPISDLGRSCADLRFMAALMVGNFLIIPLLVAALLALAPAEPRVVLGMLLVLLTPCVDYVVTFTQIARGDAKALLAATPILLLVQMALLPVYLRLFIGSEAAALVQPEPFLLAFGFLIALPLLLAGTLQKAAMRSPRADHAKRLLALAPVPATALVLFLVIYSVVPQLGAAIDSVLTVAPIYVAFAMVAPVIGWVVGHAFSLPLEQRRAVAFSTATRNSLVILPLALAVPDAVPVLVAVIVMQTLIELLSELVYVRILSRLR